MKWFRRNWWGLLLLLPALTAATYFDVRDGYRQAHAFDKNQPSVVTADGWGAFFGENLRLKAFARVSVPLDTIDEPLAVPAGLIVWQATIEVHVVNKDTFAGCDLYLVDASGRRFGAEPQQLSRMKTENGSCYNFDDETATDYETVTVFLTPADVVPVHLRAETKYDHSYIDFPVTSG